MSRVLVIPDVHLKPWIFDMVDRVDENSYDDFVILWDLVDDWGKGNDLDANKETLDRAAVFGKEHDQSLWCYGNHDVSYLWDAMESGYSLERFDLIKKYLPNVKIITMYARTDNIASKSDENLKALKEADAGQIIVEHRP